MKNRIVMLFGGLEPLNKANILYNKYIKRTKIEFLNFIKIFYKIFPTEWFVKNKRFIFALLVTAFVAFINCSMQPLPVSNKKVYSFKPIVDTTDRDTLFYRIGVRVKLDTLSESAKPMTKEDIRNIVHEESGLWVPKDIPEKDLRTMYNEAISKKIPLTIFFRLIYAESLWKSNTKSRCGAFGYTQLMPSTYAKYRKKLKLSRGATNNIKIGAYYLREMYDYWSLRKEDERLRWALALASYNGNISHIKNTVPQKSARYVDFILQNGYE